MNSTFYQIAWMIQLFMNDKKPKAIYVALSLASFLLSVRLNCIENLSNRLKSIAIEWINPVESATWTHEIISQSLMVSS